MSRIAIVAGEASGDLLGAGLIRALRRRVPDIEVDAVAGPAMKAAGCNVIEDAAVLAVMGLIEPIKHIPALLRLRRTLIDRWSTERPDVVIGIDSPDFNLGLELRLRRQGLKTVHYVSPSVWAWRQGRVRKIRKAVDKVLCLLPFEKAFYDRHGIPADFVGHPMAERISAQPDPLSARQHLGLTTARVVAVLPGSRMSEVERLGPAFAGACALLVGEHGLDDVGFVAPMASKRLGATFRQHLVEAGVEERVRLIDGESEQALTAADVALMASGTATLEAALLGTPLVAAYKVAAPTYWIARGLRLLKTPYISLPNLLTDEPLVPELTQHAATPAALAAEVADLLQDTKRRERVSGVFAGLREKLARDADERAADAVLGLIGGGLQ